MSRVYVTLRFFPTVALCSSINALIVSPKDSTLSSNFNSRNSSYNSLDTDIWGYFFVGFPRLAILRMKTLWELKRLPIISTISTRINKLRCYR